MWGIILAAGEAKRLGEHTKGLPKCLLDISDGRILERQLTALKDNNVKDIVIVTGFNSDLIKNYLVMSKELTKDLNIKLIYNDAWKDTNNSYSLRLALMYIEQKTFILLNGDVVCHPDLIKKVINAPCQNVLGVQEKREYNTEDMKIIFDDKIDSTVLFKTISEISKDIPCRDYNYEFTGIAKFSKYKGLENVLANYDNSWFESALNEMIHKNLIRIDIINVTHYPSIEIDFPRDLEKARDYFKWGQPDWEIGRRHESLEKYKRNLHDAMKLLIDFRNTLDYCHINYYCNWGLLLGLVRDGMPIIWDTDLDVTIFKQDVNKFIHNAIPLLKGRGCYVVDMNKCLDSDAWIIRDGECIEVNWVEKIGDKYIYSPNRCKLSCPAYHIDKLDTIKVMDFDKDEFKIPSDVENYLKGWYGESWKTPQKGIKPKSF